MIAARGAKEGHRSVYAFTTFFFKKLLEGVVKKWTKNVELFSYSLILVPVHNKDHWCLATIDMDAQTITYYDSLLDKYKYSKVIVKLHIQIKHPK